MCRTQKDLSEATLKRTCVAYCPDPDIWSETEVVVAMDRGKEFCGVKNGGLNAVKMTFVIDMAC